jgi:hypothetical protein
MHLVKRLLVPTLFCLMAACDGGSPGEGAEKVAPAAAPGEDAKAEEGAPEPAAENAALHIAANGDAADGDAGCVHEDHDPAACGHGAAPPAPGTEGHFGAPFNLAANQPLSKAIADIATVEGQSIQVTGTVGKVCQKKGCWMVIKDGDVQARVLMEGHFGVPMDGEGKSAVVEGTLAKRTFNEAQVKHLAKDGGENPEEVSGERTEFVLKATGVQFSAQS